MKIKLLENYYLYDGTTFWKGRIYNGEKLTEGPYKGWIKITGRKDGKCMLVRLGKDVIKVPEKPVSGLTRALVLGDKTPPRILKNKHGKDYIYDPDATLDTSKKGLIPVHQTLQ